MRITSAIICQKIEKREEEESYFIMSGVGKRIIIVILNSIRMFSIICSFINDANRFDGFWCGWSILDWTGRSISLTGLSLSLSLLYFHGDSLTFIYIHFFLMKVWSKCWGCPQENNKNKCHEICVKATHFRDDDSFSKSFSISIFLTNVYSNWCRELLRRQPSFLWANNNNEKMRVRFWTGCHR